MTIRVSSCLVGLALTALVPLFVARPASAAEPAPASEAPRSKASEAPARDVSIYARPLTALGGEYSLEVGVKVASPLVLTLEPTVIPGAKADGYGGYVGAQIFPKGRAFDGFYVHPRVGYVFVGLPSAYVHDAYAAATGGYQWVLGAGFSVRVGLGAVYETMFVSVEGNTASANKASAKLDLGLGWAF